MRWIAIFAALVLIPASASADEPAVHLKQTPGAVVEGHCAACHSLDYIVMNSPFLGALGCGSRQNDHGVWRANRSGGRQDHRG